MQRFVQYCVDVTELIPDANQNQHAEETVINTVPLLNGTLYDNLVTTIQSSLNLIMQLDLTFSLHCGNDNNDIICDIQEQVKLLLTYYRGNEFNIE